MEIIRTAAPEDAPALLAIYAPYVEGTAISFEYEPPTVEAFRHRVETTLRRWPYLVAEEDGRVLGYAYAGPLGSRRAYQWSCEVSIYLAAAAQGRGLGRRLYERLEALLRRMGIRGAYACIAVPESAPDAYVSDRSARFHAHLGYREAGRWHRCGHKFGRWYDVVWMEKELLPHTPDCPEPTGFAELPGIE